MRRHRRGVTLIELMVVLSILAVVTTVSGLAMRRADPVDRTSLTSRVAAMRRESLRGGTPVTRSLWDGSRSITLTVLPDGRIIADSSRLADSVIRGTP